MSRRASFGVEGINMINVSTGAMRVTHVQGTMFKEFQDTKLYIDNIGAAGLVIYGVT